MCRHVCAELIALAAVAWLAGAGEVRAAPAAIADKAQLFSASAVKHAAEEIKGIRKQYHHHLIIETYPKLPWSRLALRWLKGNEGEEAQLTQWAKQSSRKAGADGIYILICKEPAPIQVRVEAGRAIRDTVFTSTDCEALQAQFVSQFLLGDNDAALQVAVQSVRETLQAKAAVPPDPFPWGEMIWIVIVLLGLWVVVESIHAMAVRRSGGTQHRRAPAASIWAGSHPTALFATMTSNWLHDLLRADSRTAAAPRDGIGRDDFADARAHDETGSTDLLH